MSIPSGNQSQFFGQKVSKPGINVNQASDSQLLYKNDWSAQTFYAEDGSAISFGTNDDGTLGMQVKDNSGFVLFKMNGTTWLWYDKNTGNNVMQVGLLPDGSYGWAVAPVGQDVAQGFN